MTLESISLHSLLPNRAVLAKGRVTSIQDQTDEDLMKAYRDGSMAAFEHLYGRHKGGVYRYFLRSTKEQADAEELFQDVWIKVVNAREDYTCSAKFTTYLYRIAHNRLIDFYRHKGSAQYALRDDSSEGDFEQFSDEESLESILQIEQQAMQVKEAISLLPALQRDALLLQLEGLLSLEDIATICDTTRETIKSRLRYALAKLKQQFEGELL